MTRKTEETFYDVLKVHPRATISEIVAAYHSAKNAFSKDSVATYSLFSPEETQAILDRLEEAYLTLSNVDKKREYDLQLALRNDDGTGAPVMPEFAPAEPEAPPLEMAGQSAVPAPVEELIPVNSPTPPSATVGEEGAVRRLTTKPVSPPPIEIGDGPLTGAMLQEAREKRGLSIDDVSRITKIPSKSIRGIENDDLRAIPARVYLQGFVKNLATLYKLNPALAVRAYLAHIDSLPVNAAAS